MKKVILGLFAAASTAMVDNNIAMYAKASSQSNQIGIEILSEHEHRLGDHHWKFGTVYGFGLDFSSDEVFSDFMTGGRVAFGNNHALVLGFMIGYRIDNEFTPVMFGSQVAYQRKLEIEGNTWLEVSATTLKSQYEAPSAAKTSYAIGLKKFYFSYDK